MINFDGELPDRGASGDGKDSFRFVRHGMGVLRVNLRAGK